MAPSGLRPKDASTLILLDGDLARPSVLMGRRSAAHAFMPRLYVFPGGRVDAADGRAPASGQLRPADQRRLIDGLGTRATVRRARAIALAAIRETHEETGYRLAGDEALPDLAPLRYVARAITPPGRTRRYDTRFFAARLSDFASRERMAAPTDELEDLRWVPLARAEELNVPMITALILRDLQARLASDATLQGDPTIPFYRNRNGTVVRDEH